MRKTLAKGAAAAALGAFVVLGGYAMPGAEAADLPVYIPPPEPVWSWTGPYAGLHVGTVDGDVDDRLRADLLTAPPDSMDPNGIMGGIQAGYNFQFDSIVVGIEGDISFGDVDDVIYPTLSDPDGSFSARVEPQIDWMATIRGRIGWALDRTLFYATGGVAFTDLEIKIDAGGLGSDSDKNAMTGWTVGGGVEHAWTDNISFKAEYLYADFGKKNYSLDGFNDPLEEISGKVKLKTHTFRVGVNWLF